MSASSRTACPFPKAQSIKEDAFPPDFKHSHAIELLHVSLAAPFVLVWRLAA